MKLTKAEPGCAWSIENKSFELDEFVKRFAEKWCFVVRILMLGNMSQEQRTMKIYFRNNYPNIYALSFFIIISGYHNFTPFNSDNAQKLGRCSVTVDRIEVSK